ncbi:2-keto-4-pentenoate hydratase [Nocardioides pelophilus]|uniref:2-keto-4-pentenoate hydratase n=1 Tax=Nocardioides pelophilus TaxID=2172019 RepID=UPI0028B12C8E|nr:fumarylacetoacetate hydrolase family protein [Nocardioides pelophilus]
MGRKIGLTSAAVQAQLGVDQPDFGVLFDDMSYDDGAAVPFDAVLQPRVEAEVAFILGADLAEGELDLDQVRAAVDFALPALEICGSRIVDWDISFGDTVADNASAGAYVLGADRVRLETVEPREVEMVMRIDDEIVSTGTGAACLGDPLLALQWLARQARELGSPLRAGQVVLSGALGPMRPVAPGATVTAEISGLGSVSVRFTAEPTSSKPVKEDA